MFPNATHTFHIILVCTLVINFLGTYSSLNIFNAAFDCMINAIFISVISLSVLRFFSPPLLLYRLISQQARIAAGVN